METFLIHMQTIAYPIGRLKHCCVTRLSESEMGKWWLQSCVHVLEFIDCLNYSELNEILIFKIMNFYS